MKISRQVGTLEELVPIFIQNATVSTGAGLANVAISTLTGAYYRSDMTSTSTVTFVSTGTLGTWSSGQFLQINSTLMLGWYQFCLPNGVFAAGSTCALHIYGNLQMAPVPMEIEITRFNNQGWVSSQPHNITRIYSDVLVTSAAGVVGAVRVSSVSDKEGYGVSSLVGSVDISSIYGSPFVTSAAGVLASHVTSMRLAVDAQIVDRLLGRNIAGGSDGGRTLTEAVYVLRNKTSISGGVLTVYGTDDATSSWAADVSTTAGNPISQIDPT